MSCINLFTELTEPRELRGACVPGLVGYAGSVEEALTYIADAGMCWVDRPGLEEFVATVCASHAIGTADAPPPKKCMATDK